MRRNQLFLLVQVFRRDFPFFGLSGTKIRRSDRRPGSQGTVFQTSPEQHGGSIFAAVLIGFPACHFLTSSSFRSNCTTGTRSNQPI